MQSFDHCLWPWRRPGLECGAVYPTGILRVPSKRMPKGHAPYKACSRSADRRSWLVPPPRRQVNPSGLCAPLLAMLSMASSNRVPGRGQRPPQPHLCSSRPSCRPSGSTWGTVAACPPFSWLAGGSGHLPRGLPRCGPAPEGRASFQKLHHNRLWHLW